MSILAKITEKLERASLETSRVDWSEGARLIDACESFFVEEMGEASYLNLVIVLVEGKAQAEKPISIDGVDLGPGHSIEPDESSRRFVIEFNGHKVFNYMVYDELHARYPEAPEEFTGKWLRIFSRSHLMDFVNQTMQFVEELDGPMQHYQVVTQNHVIDVICSESPSISVLR